MLIKSARKILKYVPKSKINCVKKCLKKSKRAYVSKEQQGLGECRGKKKKVCKSDPNCTYRKSVGCVKKSKKTKRRSKFFGPIFPNL